MAHTMPDDVSSVLSPEDAEHWRRGKHLADVDGSLNARFRAVYRGQYGTADIDERRFVNFGPGRFRHPYWRNADRIYEGRTWSQKRAWPGEHGQRNGPDIAWNLLESTPVDVESGSIAVAYTSHVVEHAWDENALFFFSEVYRILRPGGLFRVTTPDADLCISAWRQRDEWFYPRRRVPPEEHGMMLLKYMSLVCDERNSFYVRPNEADAFLESAPSVHEALTRASRLSDVALQRECAEHVNWFNAAKLQRMLHQVGFATVYQSGYAQSQSGVLRDTRYFDSTDPHMTCFVEAVK